MSSKVVDKGWKKISSELRKADKTLSVGIFQESTTPDGSAVAQYAYYNEFGTKRIPERSFMRSYVDGNKRLIDALIKSQYKKVTGGDQTIDGMMRIIGNFVEGGIKNRIINLRTPPNAPSTIAGKGSSNPLIDTGRMLGEIKHEIRDGKK